MTAPADSLRAVPADRDPERGRVRALLEDAGLPVDDLDAAGVSLWLVLDGEGATAGCFGLEGEGGDVLLRSVAVPVARRGTGTGTTLVALAERVARDRGATRLVLLTQTAAPFFAALGYATVDRAGVAGAVRESAQFRTLCPASAACLAKRLGVA